MKSSVPTSDSQLKKADSPANDSASDPVNATYGGNHGLYVKVVSDADSLQRFVPAWDDLAASALEPNVFFESWMLLPALRAFGPKQDLLLVLVFQRNKQNPSPHPELLHGLFPLVRGRRYKGLPVSFLSFWEHPYFPVHTPLVRAESARACLETFFSWLIAGSPESGKVQIMEFNHITGEGPFHQLLVELLHRVRPSTLVLEAYTRAFFRPAKDADAYFQQSLSGSYRSQMKRKGRRLSECGHHEYKALTANDDVDPWIREFLELEASGWKGEQASAMAKDPVRRDFFVAITAEAHRRRRLIMLKLQLNGHPIASICAFTADRGAFDFKLAYDEKYGRYSPGVLLELERIRYLHSRPDIDWMDSCSSPDNFRNSLWSGRRTITSISIATGRSGGLVVSALPVLRWLKQGISRPVR